MVILFLYDLRDTKRYYCLVFENLRVRISTWFSVKISFFLIQTSFCLFIIGGDVYCFSGSHTRTHTHAPGHAHTRTHTHTWTRTQPDTHTNARRTSLNKWLTHRKDLYLSTHNIRKRQTSMPLEGFEPVIPASERPWTYALDRVTTGIGSIIISSV